MDIAELLRMRKRGLDVGFILPILEEQIVLDAAKGSLHRRRDTFHPSEICRSDFCPRAWMLGYQDPTLYENQKVPVQLQKKFDVGKMLHKYIQKKLGNAGVLFGLWECHRMCEGESCFYFGFNPIKVCDKVCDKARWKYRELTVFDPNLNIRGNIDGVVIIGDKKYGLEFKSMNSGSYSTLIQPVESDKEQSLWYVDVMSRNGIHEWNEICTPETTAMYKDAQKIIDMPFNGSVVMYMNKDTQDIREFFVEGTVLDSIEKKKKLLKKTLTQLKKGTLPQRLYLCDEPAAKRARRCMAVKSCFKEGV